MRSKHGRGRRRIAIGGATFFAPRAAPASGTRLTSCAAAWRRSMTTSPSASASDNSLRSNPRAGRCSRRAAARGSPAKRLPRWCRRPNFIRRAPVRNSVTGSGPGARTIMFDEHLQRWNVTIDGAPAVTATSALLPVRWGDTPAMLKVAVHAEEKRGNQLMIWWDGHGAARLLAHGEDA